MLLLDVSDSPEEVIVLLLLDVSDSPKQVIVLLLLDVSDSPKEVIVLLLLLLEVGAEADGRRLFDGRHRLAQPTTACSAAVRRLHGRRLLAGAQSQVKVVVPVVEAIKRRTCATAALAGVRRAKRELLCKQTANTRRSCDHNGSKLLVICFWTA